MAISPVSPYSCYTTQAAAIQNMQPAAKYNAPEAFEGEKTMLKAIYDNYIKQAGGFQNINGQMVHTTTVLHTNQNAQQAVIAIERRLQELGVLQF